MRSPRGSDRYAGRTCVAVGHRVVHGGAGTPDRQSSAGGARRASPLIPLAPLHQPYNLAAIDAVSDRLPGVPQVACFDTSFHRGGGPSPKSCRCRARSVARPSNATASTASRTSTSRRCCPTWHRRSPAAASSSRISAAARSLCAMKAGKSVDHTLGFTALDGLCMGTRPGALDPGRGACICFRRLGFTPGGRRPCLQAVGAARHLGYQQRHARSAREPRAVPRLAVDYFVYRAAKEIGALAAVLGGVDGLVFTAGIGERAGGDPQAELRRLGLARRRARRGGQRSGATAYLDGDEQGVGVDDSNQRRNDDRPAHRAVAGTGRGSIERAPAAGAHMTTSSGVETSGTERRQRRGADSGRASGRSESTSVTSSSRTTSHTRATSRSSRPRPPARQASGRS